MAVDFYRRHGPLRLDANDRSENTPHAQEKLGAKHQTCQTSFRHCTLYDETPVKT